MWFSPLPRPLSSLSLQIVFSPEEHVAVQAALDQKLGPEYISQRPGAGGQKVRKQLGGCGWSAEHDPLLLEAGRSGKGCICMGGRGRVGQGQC